MDYQENMYNVKFEMQNIDEIHDYFREVVDEEIKQEEVDRQEKIDNEKDAIDDVGDYRKRQKKHEKDEDNRQAEEVASNAKKVLADAFKGMLAGFSIGKLLDLALPREQLDNWTETRTEAIKAGFGDSYKDIKAGTFEWARQLNDKMGVAAIGGDEITSGIQQAIRSGIDEGMLGEFARAATLAKSVGAELGDGVAEQFNIQYGKRSPEIIETLANVFGSTKLSESYKTQIMSMVAENGTLFKNLNMDVDKAARNYSSALAVMQKSNVMTLDQSKEMFDMVSKAARGDSEAMVQLAKLGVDVDGVIGKFKNADFGGVFQDVTKSIQKLPKNVEALKAMDLGIDENLIMRVQNAGDEINSLQAQTNKLVGESTEMVDGLTKAELRAKEVAESSWADRMQNWLGTTKMLEGVSDILERLNVDASTASGAVGAVVSGAGSLFTTLMQVQMISGAASGKGIMSLGAAFMGAAKGIGSAVLAAGPWIVAIGAIAAGAYLIYQNWDTVVEYWDKSIAWISETVNEFSNFFIDCWNKAVDFVLDVPNKVANVFTEMKDKALSIFNMLPDGVKSAFDFIYDLMLNHPVLKLLNWGFEKVGEIGTKIKGWWNKKKGSEPEPEPEPGSKPEPGSDITPENKILQEKIDDKNMKLKEVEVELEKLKLMSNDSMEEKEAQALKVENLMKQLDSNEVQKVEIQGVSAEPRTAVTVQNELASKSVQKVEEVRKQAEKPSVVKESSSKSPESSKIDFSSLEFKFDELASYLKLVAANTGSIEKNTKQKVEPVLAKL